MPAETPHSASTSAQKVEGGTLAPWDVGTLPPAPQFRGKQWIGLIGPGVLLAGASIGSGEWLFGPAVTAQYGGTLLWMASVSIILQVFCNLEMMRYTLYCGEPILVGCFRTRPNPLVWTMAYVILDIAAIWPFNAANAATPLAAAILGHLPGVANTTLLGVSMSEKFLVTLLGYMVFLLAFLPLIFGGVIYRMIERVMTAKLIFVLVYLVLITAFTVSWGSAREILAGFFRFGQVPIRADTVVVAPHFSVLERDDQDDYILKGTTYKGEGDKREGDLEVTEFSVKTNHGKPQQFKLDKLDKLKPDQQKRLAGMKARVRELLVKDGFFLRDAKEGPTLTIQGTVDESHVWHAQRISVAGPAGTKSYGPQDTIPSEIATRVQVLVAGQGVESVGLWSYWRKHSALPDLDWAMVVAFIAIAGAGGLSNTLFSNYARDKGWGMGIHVGAIPSAFGARQISLSHVGRVFHVTDESRRNWRGWFKHIVRDQVGVWMFCCFVGMALPCMVSLEFIRNAPVGDTRVGAMTASGMADRYTVYGPALWVITLVCGFLVLAPGQIVSADQIARRWTDIIWSSNSRSGRFKPHHVKYLYYGILAGYAVWGMIALSAFTPLAVAKIGSVLMNVALGFCSLHTLYVNRTLLPPQLRPNLFMQVGLTFAGLFYLGISVVVLWTILT